MRIPPPLLPPPHDSSSPRITLLIEYILLEPGVNPQSHPWDICSASSWTTLGGSEWDRAELGWMRLGSHLPKYLLFLPSLIASVGQVAALGGGGWTEVSAEGLLYSPSPYLTLENLSVKSCNYETFLKYIQLEYHHKPPVYIHGHIWPSGFISLAEVLTVHIKIPLWCPFVVGLSPCL